MTKLLASFFLLLFLLIPSFTFAAYSSNICTSSYSYCTEEEVGSFLKEITKGCGNQGNCELRDIMMVITNIGNFVLKIVGSLVLFFYVLGGFWYLASHGDDAWVKKGKTAIKQSTFGLLVVMFAYLGVQTLYSVLTDAKIGTKYVVCGVAGDATNGKQCGSVSSCQQGGCYWDGGLLLKAGYDKTSEAYCDVTKSCGKKPAAKKK